MARFADFLKIDIVNLLEVQDEVNGRITHGVHTVNSTSERFVPIDYVAWP